MICGHMWITKLHDMVFLETRNKIYMIEKREHARSLLVMIPKNVPFILIGQDNDILLFKCNTSNTNTASTHLYIYVS